MPIIGNNDILFECFGKVNASFVHCGLRACFVQMHQLKDRSNVLHPRENRTKHTIWPLARSTHSHLLPPTCTGLYTHTHTPSLTVSAGQSCPWPVIRPGQPRACCLPAGLVPPTFLSSNQPTHTHTCKHARTHTHIHCSCCPSGCPVLTIISLS